MKARIRRLWFQGSPIWHYKGQYEYMYHRPLARYLQTRTVRYSFCDELEDYFTEVPVAIRT